MQWILEPALRRKWRSPGATSPDRLSQTAEVEKFLELSNRAQRQYSMVSNLADFATRVRGHPGVPATVTPALGRALQSTRMMRSPIRTNSPGRKNMSTDAVGILCRWHLLKMQRRRK